MAAEKSEKTFPQQMLSQLSEALSREKALTFIAQAKSQKDSGPISRVFNELGLNLPRDDLDTLLDAREKGGWFSFTKTIAKQVEPVINQLFYGEKPTPFDTFYNQHFAGTSFTEEDIKSKLVSGIITLYAECATAAMATAYPRDPFFMSDSINAINEVAKLIQTSEAVKASAQSTLNNPGPIKAHIETLKTVDQKKVAMLATNDISILYDDTVKARQTLQALKSDSPNVLQLIEILLKFEASMGGYALDPDDGPLEDALLVILKKLSGIREQIDALPNKGATSTFSSTRQNISDSIKAIEPLLEKNLYRLEKAALQRLDLKLGINISEIIQTLDTQLTALEALTKKHAIFSKKDKPAAKNAQTAIDTIKEIRRTLIEDATALSVEHSIEAIPALGKKIALLNDALQQTATDLITHTRGPIRQAIHTIFEPILKTIGDFIAWSTGYVLEGVARRRAAATVETQLKANEGLRESLSQMSLTDENSPAILTEPPSSSLDTLVADFQRALEADELFVNGKPLSEYAADFHDFAHRADVVQFMSKVILKDVHWCKGKMLSYMQEKLHHDGLLRPVTSALQEAMVERPNTSEKPYRVASISDAACKRRVEITSSKIGFSIQETLSVDKLRLEPIPHKGEESSLYRASKDKATLSAEIEGSPIVSARGAVQVNFYSGNSGGRPALTPVENTITYGHRTLAEKMTLLRKEKEHRLTQSSEEGLTDTESRSSTPRLDDSEKSF